MYYVSFIIFINKSHHYFLASSYSNYTFNI